MLKVRRFWWLLVAVIVAGSIIVLPSVGFSAITGGRLPWATPGQTEAGSPPGDAAPVSPDGEDTNADTGNTSADPDKPVSNLDPTPTTGNATPSGQQGGTPSGPMKKEPAPIEEVDIAVRESMPPQYVAHVTYGLPSGCAQPGGHEVKREGDEVTIVVSILLPADPNTVCTMIYGIDDVNIDLGSDFTSGTTYTVRVNDRVTTFTAQ